MAKYNPKEPVTIHNPYPKKLWPFKEGRRVWVIRGGCSTNSGIEIYSGKVRWYNPKPSSYWGPKPHYTIYQNGLSDLVDADHVRPYTRKGKKELETMVKKRWIALTL